MKLKRVISIFVVINFLNVAFHFIVWSLYTENILNSSDSMYVGDLSRIGYISDSSHIRKTETTLPKIHIESHDINFSEQLNHYEIVTFGDSFSNGQAKGLNPFYQDYISSLYSKNVLNIQDISNKHYCDTIVWLLESGLFKETKTKYVILESVERAFIGRFSSDFHLDERKSRAEITALLDKKRYVNHVPKYNFINNGNYKFVWTNFLRHFSDNGYNNIVYKMPLSTELFTATEPNFLLFFGDDLKNQKNATLPNLKLANENLNKLAKLLFRDGIQLIVLVAPDKYTVYSDFLVEKNKYGRSNFFENFSSLKKDYIFINSKDIFQKAIINSEKDLYYADDTHWSYKASELLVKKMNFLKN